MALRAYQIINEAKKDENVLCTTTLERGKFHPTIAYEFSRGSGLFVMGGQQLATYRIDVYQYNAETGHSCWLECETRTEPEAILRCLEKFKAKYAKGKPVIKLGRPKKNLINK